MFPEAIIDSTVLGQRCSSVAPMHAKYQILLRASLASEVDHPTPPVMSSESTLCHSEPTAHLGAVTAYFGKEPSDLVIATLVILLEYVGVGDNSLSLQ